MLGAGYLLTHQRESASGKAWYPIWRPGWWRRRTGERERSSWCDCERHSETSVRVRQSLPGFLYNRQNHLNYSVTTARKSLSPTAGQLRRVSVLYGQLLEQQMRTVDRSGAGPGPAIYLLQHHLQHQVPVSPVQSSPLLCWLTLSHCNVNIIPHSHLVTSLLSQPFVIKGYFEMSPVCLSVCLWYF